MTARVIALVEGPTVTDGNLAATRIGLDIMREKCPHFNGWLSKLEALGQNYRTGK